MSYTHVVGSGVSGHSGAHEAASGWKVQATWGAGNDSSNFAPGLEGERLHSRLEGPSPTHSSIIWMVS